MRNDGGCESPCDRCGASGVEGAGRVGYDLRTVEESILSYDKV